MSSVIELRPLPSTAEAWCARLHAHDVSDADRIAFQAWLSASADHRAEYELCALTFSVSRALPPSSPPPLWERAGVGGSLRKYGLPAIAAVFALVAFALWHLNSSQYATDIGEQRTISLADGSTVELNTNSSIGVDLGESERRVTLRHGEAFFSIVPDAARPFIVQAGASEVRVLGTKFNVRMEGETALVTVVEGHVKVSGLDLLPGEGATARPERPIAKLPVFDTTRLTSWREGKIHFENDALSKVINEVNRYSDPQFVIPDPRVRALTLSGVFRIGDVDSVAFALQQSYGLRTERDGGYILVKPAS
jgi:transmembrane sensor